MEDSNERVSFDYVTACNPETCSFSLGKLRPVEPALPVLSSYVPINFQSGANLQIMEALSKMSKSKIQSELASNPIKGSLTCWKSCVCIQYWILTKNISFCQIFVSEALSTKNLPSLLHPPPQPQVPRSNSSNAACSSQINRFISLICKGTWLVPLPFPSSPGGSAGGVCLLAHTLYVLRSVAVRGGEWMRGLSGSWWEC